MDNLNITYVMALWLGNRRSKFYNKCWDIDIYFHLKQHIMALNKLNNPHIKKVIIVINHFNNTIDKNVPDIVNKIGCKYPVEYIFRPNQFISYGAWQEVIMKTLDDDNNYYFFMEDDYIPVKDEFYMPFYKLFDEKTGYVCQLILNSHAAISNGLMSKKVCKTLLEKYDRVFDLVKDPLDSSQEIYLNSMQTAGFKLKDIAGDYKILFHESSNDNVVVYGNKENDNILIEPVNINTFIFRKMEEKDLKFVNEIRNGYCEKYLHSSIKYSMEETLKWFQTQNPLFYIIQFMDTDIGYFRTSNYSKENKNIYIGADIMPQFTGNGLGFSAYKQFMKFMFEEFKLHKISLEVIDTNENAIKLYEKLGFKHEGTKREEVLKGKTYIGSRIYSILKTEFEKNNIKK